MNTYTATRTRKFGTQDSYDASLARHNAKYGTNDPAEQGRMILEAQRAANRTRQEATVNQCDNPQEHEGFPCNHPNEGTIDTLHMLAASRTPWISADKVELFARTNSAEVVAARIDWLEKQPIAKQSPVQDYPRHDVDSDTHKAAEARHAAKATPGRVEVPEGRYAVVGEDHVTRFYKVDRPTEGRWAGYVFVKVQASDELHNLRSKASRNDVLRRIAEAGIEASMALYGKELGKCGHCGRTLTDEESRAYGIGPICRGKMGF